MSKDTLFLLVSDFEDEAFPNTRFYCSSCTFFEGLLTIFPTLEEAMDVRRIPFKRPRSELVAHVGESNQTCPILVLGTNSNHSHATGHYGDNAFIKGQLEIASYLAETYGIAVAHP